MIYCKKWIQLKQKEDTLLSTRQLSIPIYLINLDRSPHRLLYMTQQLASSQLSSLVNRVSAVDGKNIQIQKTLPVMQIPCNIQYLDTITGHSYYRKQIQMVANSANGTHFPIQCSPYELGCTLSHWKAFEQIQQNKHPVALILEDDISFEYMSRWPCSLSTILSLAPKDWTIIQLYTNHRNHAHQLYESPELFHPVSSQLINNYWGTGCYLITQQGIKNLLSQRIETPEGPTTYEIQNEILADRLVYQQPGAYVFTFPLVVEHSFYTNDIVRPFSHTSVHEQMTTYTKMIYSMIPSSK